MAQTVAEIKKSMTDKFISNQTIIDTYELDPNKSFEEQFSKVSIESIVFYIVAFCVYSLQLMFDTHKAEVVTIIESKKPHTAKWLEGKILAFRYGRDLNEETGEYDLTDVDLQATSSELIVKYCSVIESAGRAFVKVAGGSDIIKEPLTAEQKTALEFYVSRIKDLGVIIGDDVNNKTSVINEHADAYACQLTVYYDPLILDGNGMNLSLGTYPVTDAIKYFVQNNIKFNGEYSNVALTDYLQTISGIVIPEFMGAQGCTYEQYVENGTASFKSIFAKSNPYSGYYKIYDDSHITVNYVAYQVNENI